MMTKKITRDHIDAAYEVARQVFVGGMRAGEGAARLAEERVLNLNSARALIRCYGHLRKGERYTRTLSTPAADAFLGRIFADDGAVALAQGIASVWAHLEYYEAKTGTTTHALREDRFVETTSSCRSGLLGIAAAPSLAVDLLSAKQCTRAKSVARLTRIQRAVAAH